MNVYEIQAAMAELVLAMLDKGIVTPNAQIEISERAIQACLKCQYESKALDGSWLKYISGDSFEMAIAKARDFIASLPSPETIVLQTYLGKLADAIDYGHTNGIAAEYVDPARITQKAMSDNLLTAVSA